MNAPAHSVTSADRHIDSISKLKMEGDSYTHVLNDDRVKKLILDGQSFYVSADGIIYTTDHKSAEFDKIKSLVKQVVSKWDFRIVTEEVLAFLKISSGIAGTPKESDKTATSIETNTKAQTQFYSIIADAVSQGASDVHFMIRSSGKKCFVLFRIAGTLRLQTAYNSLSHEQHTGIVRAAINYDAVVKGGDSNKQFSFNEPNDTQLPVSVKNKGTINLRVGSMPAGNDSCKVSMRLLAVDSSGKIRTLKELGFLPEQVELITEATRYPYGAIIFSGPTGSGKSTAIQSGIDLISADRSVITIEQPIENLIDKVNVVQCPVNEDNPTTTWKNLLKSSLRNDPDVIMVGEVRDEVVASIATRAATTGHLLLTTLHVNTALEVPSALEYYELPLHTIVEQTFLRLIVAQRLLPRICGQCRVPLADAPDDHTFRRIKQHFSGSGATVFIRNHDGCDNCYKGINGRELIAEVVKLDTVGRRFILARRTDDWRAHLKANGWKDMKDHAEIKIKQGLICPREAEKDLLTPFGVDSIDDTFKYDSFREDILK